MPLVTVNVIEGVFRRQQKQETIRRITDTVVAQVKPKTRKRPREGPACGFWKLPGRSSSGHWALPESVNLLPGGGALPGRVPAP
jgi:Tautomerase enzyme